MTSDADVSRLSPTPRPRALRPLRMGAAVVSLAVALAGCAAPSPTERLRMYHADVEAKERFIANLDTYENPALTGYLDGVMARLTESARVAPQRVRVLDTSHANAYASEKEGVRITRGMLALISDEAELAFVLGHEVAHLHATEDSLAKSAFLARMESGDDPVALLSSILQRREIAADRMATVMLRDLGYDGDAARRVIRKFEALDGDAGDDAYVLSHPAGAERIAALPAAQGGAAGAEAYRAAVDGLPFGGWGQMYFQHDRRITAPFLELAFPMPAGFEIEEQDGAFLRLEDARTEMTFVFTNAASMETEPESVLRTEIYFDLDRRMDLGRLREIRRFRAFGDAETVTARATIADTDPSYEISFLLVAHRGDWLVGMLFHPSRDRAVAAAILKGVVDGFEDASPTDRSRLRFGPYRPGERLSDLAAGFGEGEEGMRLFRRANDLGDGQAPRPGQVLKRILPE